jgi:hypothetical protein
MKTKIFLIIWLFTCLFQVNFAIAQSPSQYKLPGVFHFDYEVVQGFVHDNNVSDTSLIHFFYSRTGDYAAARINGKGNMKENLLIVITNDGTGIIFNERNKNITIISIRKLISDLSGLTKWIRMDSLIANMRKKTDGKDLQSVKTGNTKQVGSYTSEEYSVSDNKSHKANVWCAKVDFNTQTDYLLGSVGSNFLKMMSGRMATHPLFQALIQPKTLVTDIETSDSAQEHRMNMHTLSINQSSVSISTSGYVVNDYSTMTVPEIFQAEMRKRNH